MSKDERREAREAILRFESGQTDFEEYLDPQGVRTFMIRDPEDPRFFRVEAEEGVHQFQVTLTGLRFPPSGHRPRELPGEVPFLPGTTTVVMLMPATGSTIIRWEDPEEPDEALRQVREMLLESAWAETEVGVGKEPSPKKAIFQRGQVTRTLCLVRGEDRTDLVLTEELRGDGS